LFFGVIILSTCFFATESGTAAECNDDPYCGVEVDGYLQTCPFEGAAEPLPGFVDVYHGSILKASVRADQNGYWHASFNISVCPATLTAKIPNKVGCRRGCCQSVQVTVTSPCDGQYRRFPDLGFICGGGGKEPPCPSQNP